MIRRYFLYVVVPIYAAPLLLSLSLPFAYWDWLMAPYYQLRSQAYEWSELLQNILFVTFLDPIQFRPLSALLMNLQYLLLHGEFWAWYLIKWSIFGVTVALIYRSSLAITRQPIASGLAAAFFALHPMPAVLDLISQDLYVVTLGALATHYWFLHSGRFGSGASGDIARQEQSALQLLSRKEMFVLGLLIVATVAAKEIGIGVLLAFLLAEAPLRWRDCDRRWLIRFGVLIALLVGVLFRLLSVRHPTSHLDQLLQDGSFERLLQVMRGAITAALMIVPASPWKMLLGLSAAIALYGVVMAIVRERHYLRPVVFAGTGLLISCGIIGVTYPCPKYLPVPVWFFSYLLAIGAAILLSRIRRTAIIAITAFAVLIPASTAPSIYAQWLGMMQSLYEMSDLIHEMEKKARDGYELTWTGHRSGVELPWEKGETFREFFTRASVTSYGYDRPLKFSVLAESGVPMGQKFVMLTSLSSDSVKAGALSKVGITSLRNVTEILTFERERYGFFETLVGLLKRWETAIGNAHPEPVDCQPPRPSRYSKNMPNPSHEWVYFPLHAGPHYLYVFDPETDRGPVADVKVTVIPALRRYGAFAR